LESCKWTEGGLKAFHELQTKLLGCTHLLRHRNEHTSVGWTFFFTFLTLSELVPSAAARLLEQLVFPRLWLEE
jgi:hypothetical protein